MQILIIDNNIDPDSWGATELCTMARIKKGATIRVRRAPAHDLPSNLDKVDRIILSGSKTGALDEAPWIDELDDFVREAVHRSKPILGVCYGHQSLARALGSRKHVRNAQHGEFGWGKIELTSTGLISPLMRNMPPAFHTFQWHNDEVCELVEGMQLLASSEICPIQAFQLEGKPIFGVQFHPERGLAGAERSLARKHRDNPNAPFVNDMLGKKLFDAKVGETLFRNFLTMEA